MTNGQIFYHKNLSVQIHKSNSRHLICKEEIIFFGEVFDFENPQYTNAEIVNSIINLNLEKKIEKLNKLTGFFIFIFFEDGKTYIFNCKLPRK